jgi:hypothetical protein
MMRTIKELKGDEVFARDGRLGWVEDVYFDDERWAVRYLLVNTGRWLPGKRVLIPPAFVEPELSSGRKLRLALTRGEADRAWDGAPQLRSGAEVMGYSIEARDGSSGEVLDFVVDGRTWTIRDVLVKTTKWWPGGHVRVHPASVERIDRQQRKIRLSLTRDQVKRSRRTAPRS